jgi:hypothetical protein
MKKALEMEDSRQRLEKRTTVHIDSKPTRLETRCRGHGDLTDPYAYTFSYSTHYEEKESL